MTGRTAYSTSYYIIPISAVIITVVLAVAAFRFALKIQDQIGEARFDFDVARQSLVSDIEPALKEGGAAFAPSATSAICRWPGALRPTYFPPPP